MRESGKKGLFPALLVSWVHHSTHTALLLISAGYNSSETHCLVSGFLSPKGIVPVVCSGSPQGVQSKFLRYTINYLSLIHRNFMVWIPHFIWDLPIFLILPDHCPNILFPLLNAPWICPLGNPFVSCTDLGQISLQPQTLCWWFFVSSCTRQKEIVNRAGIVCTVGTQPWLPVKGLQQLTCSQLRSHFLQKCRYGRQDPHVPCHTH